MNINHILTSHGVNRKVIRVIQEGGGGEDTGLDKTPPPPITEILALPRNNSVILSWKNPTDTDFVGVRIQRKVGGYPESVTDGVTIFSGYVTTFTDTLLTNNLKYYYRFFPYDYDNNYNTDESLQVSMTPMDAKIYGIEIDLENSNPTTAVTYTHDAVNMSAGSSWDSVFPYNQIRPVLLNSNGEVTAYLNPNNYAVDTSGKSVNITSGDNVMVRFPKVWYKIERVGTKLICQIATGKIDDSFVSYAHTNGNVDNNEFYVGVYDCMQSGSTLKSWYNTTAYPTRSISIENSRTQAKANGKNWGLLGFHQLTLLQLLMVIRGKTINLNSFYGDGAQNNAGMNPISSTSSNTKGLYYDASHGIKIMGMENFVGNVFNWVDGVRLTTIDGVLHIQITKNTNKFNNTDFTEYETYPINPMTTFIKDVYGTNELGFLGKTGGATQTTYFCNTNFIQNVDNSFVAFGANYRSTYKYGAFSLFSSQNGTGGATIGARLMYIKGE